ncbi:MAG TPA: COR domain-containing protein [Pyrinomonadaceae bacterium]|jgi:internalin A
MAKDKILRRIREAAQTGQAYLRLDKSLLTDLPPEIGQLTNLTELYVNGNQLSRLPPKLKQLTNLKVLDLGSNRFTKLPPVLGQLPSLTELHLSNNQLKELPAALWQLPNLRELCLDSNQLTQLPPEIAQLSNLTELNLRNNQLTALPAEIGQLPNLTKLYLDGNQLAIPPEILDKVDEPATIINYYLEHQAGRKKPLNEAKVLVVGQGSVGKTSLVKRLVQDDFNPQENKTDGIDIQKWQVLIDGQPVRLNVWDFGGQEIMHATHQFFLTKRSLYLLVIDARLGAEENHIEDWLKIIKSFGQDSPVIIVGNKIDQQPLDIDRRGLQAKYPSIKAFVDTSCPQGHGIAELKSVITREVGALPHIHDQLLINWFTVKTRLEEMKEDYILYQDYVRLCQTEQITDEISQATLLGFLHDLGIVLNFRDDPRLVDTNILNPEWVTRAVYKILNSHLLFQSKGVLERPALSLILDSHKYPKDKHLFIIDMMRKFELCFDFDGLRDQRFLIPDLLSREEPDTGEWRGALAFQYHYNVLPSSIISRFIVRMHQSINKNTLWRTGVILKNNEGNRALVKADLEDRKIYIWLSGPERSRRRFLEVIRADFDSIHKTIPGIVADEKVPLPARPEIVVDYKHLLRLEAKGIADWIPEGLDETVNVKTLLDGIEAEETRRERQETRFRDERFERASRTTPPAAPPLPDDAPAAGEFTSPPRMSVDDAAALAQLKSIKAKLDRRSENFGRWCLLTGLLFLVVLGVALSVLIRYLGWTEMPAWTYPAGGIPIIAAYGYFAFTQQEFSPRAIYEHIIARTRRKNYRAAGFDLEQYERLTKQSAP